MDEWLEDNESWERRKKHGEQMTPRDIILWKGVKGGKKKESGAHGQLIKIPGRPKVKKTKRRTRE